MAEHAGGRPGVRRRRCERGSHFAQQNDGLPLVSFGGGREGGREGAEHTAWSLPPSLARLKSFHHSLARSLTTRPLCRRTSRLPPPLSLYHNTTSSVDPRSSRCQVGCRLSTRAMGDSRRSDISTCHKREAAAAAAENERPLLLLFGQVDGDWKSRTLTRSAASPVPTD